MNRDDVAVQRWLILGLALSTTAAVSTRLLAIFRVDGVSLLEMALLAVFALLFCLIATSFWIACLGAHALWRGATDLALREPDSSASHARTVLVVPVYNENAREVFARIQAMQESLCEAGAADSFDFFVLSDSTDQSCRAAEEAAWRRLRRQVPSARIFYRHRAQNIAHKSGNIADFCRNWGGMYEYMVVLDADSLMTGSTLARLVRLMDANPRAALIQVPPLLVGGQSLFARSQQFASWAYGRMHAAGLAKLQGPDGNYWGHNAIIRLRPFADHCGLPVLPGRPPLGGEIMSHDFVEAALLRRAGWEVWMAPDLHGSYETSPPTLIDHLKRDRRWCQGNQANDLARERGDAVARSFAFHHLEDAVHGGLLEVGEVHGDLGQAADQKSSALHEAHSAIRKANGLRDLLGDLDIGSVEEDVVSDEELARADDRCTRGGMHARLAEVRTAGGVGRDLGADAFKLAAANVLQALTLGSSRGGLVQINRNLVALPNLFANMVRHGDAVLHGDAVDGDEWDDVGGPHARMRARVYIQVDQLGGLSHPANGGFLNGLALTHQGEDRSSVRV